MSMNLRCKEFNLPQIPTHLSYMIYSNGDGGNVGILYRYERYIYLRHQNSVDHLSLRYGMDKTEYQYEISQVDAFRDSMLKQLKDMRANIDNITFFVS